MLFVRLRPSAVQRRVSCAPLAELTCLKWPRWANFKPRKRGTNTSMIPGEARAGCLEVVQSSQPEMLSNVRMCDRLIFNDG